MEDTCDHRPLRPVQETWIAAVAVFLLVLPVMSRLTGIPLDRTNLCTDHPAHLNFASKLAGDWRECLPHPLYHIALVILSGGNVIALAGVAATLLSLMIAVRAFQTIQILSTHETGSAAESGNKQWWRIFGLAVLLALAMPLPNWWKYGVYLGQPTPNVWHNPTTIFCMPIVLALFKSGVRSTHSLQLNHAALTGLLFALCTLAKPNFPLAFAPCCAVMLACQLQIHGGIDLKRWYSIVRCGAVTFGPLVLLMGVQFAFTFGSAKPDASGIEIAPFKVWSQLTPNITASIFLGLGFPLTVVVFYPQKCRYDSSLPWAWLTLVIALLQLSLLAETGPRWEHGNFLWGSIFATAIVFIFSARALVDVPIDGRRRVCTAVLCLHAGSGLWYLVRALREPTQLTLF